MMMRMTQPLPKPMVLSALANPKFGYLVLTTPSAPVFKRPELTPRYDISGSINSFENLTSGVLEVNGRIVAQNHPGVLNFERILVRLQTIYDQLLGPEAEKAAIKKAKQRDSEPVEFFDTDRPLTVEEERKTKGILSEAFQQYYRLFVEQVSQPLVGIINGLSNELVETERADLKTMVNEPDQFLIDPYADFMHYATFGE
jgi:hypothetical protein